MSNTATTTIRLFGIKKCLDEMSPGAAMDARKLLPKVAGVGMSRVNKMIYATEAVPTTMTTIQARAFADFFGVPLEVITDPYEDDRA